MKIGITINIGNFENMKFESSEFNTEKECINNLCSSMFPASKFFKQINERMELIKKLYGV